MFAAIHSDHFWNLFDEVSDLHLSFLHRLQDFRKACHCIQIIELHVLGSIEDMPFSLIKFIVVKICKGFAFTFCSLVLEEMTYRSHRTQCTKIPRIPCTLLLLELCSSATLLDVKSVLHAVIGETQQLGPAGLSWRREGNRGWRAWPKQGRFLEKHTNFKFLSIERSQHHLAFVSRWSLQLRPRKSKRIGWSRKQWWHRWEMVGIHFAANFAFWGFLSSDCWVSLWV